VKLFFLSLPSFLEKIFSAIFWELLKVIRVPDWNICGVLSGLHHGMRLVGDGALSHPNIRRLRGAREALLSGQSGDSSVPESGLLLRSAIFFFTIVPNRLHSSNEGDS
jgi:hypothetical protein